MYKQALALLPVRVLGLKVLAFLHVTNKKSAQVLYNFVLQLESSRKQSSCVLIDPILSAHSRLSKGKLHANAAEMQTHRGLNEALLLDSSQNKGIRFFISWLTMFM